MFTNTVTIKGTNDCISQYKTQKIYRSKSIQPIQILLLRHIVWVLYYDIQSFVPFIVIQFVNIWDPLNVPSIWFMNCPDDGSMS